MSPIQTPGKIKYFSTHLPVVILKLEIGGKPKLNLNGNKRGSPSLVKLSDNK